MDITKELISLMAGVVFLVAMVSFFYSMYEPPYNGVADTKNFAAEDIAHYVSECCRKHSGSYRTYNDDCEMMDVNITDGDVTREMIAYYLPEGCELAMNDIITGEAKIKVTYLGRERKVAVTVIN